MAYVTIPKDLSKIKTKVMFGLTKRQLVCFGAAALVGVPLFFLTRGSLGTTAAALCMILVMLPFFLFAMLFEKQYILTETVTTETRYRTETDTWVDAEGNIHTDTYQVPYTYTICTVTLENFNLSHFPVYIMSEEQLSLYAGYMSGVGGRPELYPDSEYVTSYITNPPAEYEIPAEHLTDERFATLIAEAEKYLGYPYVWGGSSPATSFDCSGFVSYVLTNSGLCNTGRLGAQGLYNICTPVSAANAEPGDLVFFVGTYDTPGVSHVGFYVGDGMFLHCGDPIQYANLNTSYWQSHFYAYGRPPYD